ncbi:MAG TPA: PKD domain-containing protein [Solirubrobacterales bacterium]|nr:PKD domain-containing protein [Solirubrobacterales bacterium]
MTRSVGAVLICTLLALGAGASTASAAPTWLAPKDISGLNQSITFPEVAVNAGGDAVAIWPRDVGSETIIEAAERPAGGDWSEPVVLSDPTEEEPSNVHVALDAAGNAVAVWSAFDQGFVIRSAARPAGGEWSEPEDLFVEDGHTPYLAMNAAGEAVAVWTGFDGVDDEVTWAAVRSAGGDWSAPEELSVAGEQDGFSPRVAIDAAGNAIAVWQRFDLSHDVVQAAVRTACGDWSTPDEISAASDDARSPRIAMNAAGDAVAAWTILSSGGIQAAARPAGGDWSAPEEVSAEGGVPALCVDSSGNAFAIWSGPGSAEQILRAAMRPPGGEWSGPEDLSAEAETFQSYELAANSAAGVIATWTRGVSSTSHEVQAAVRPPGGDWQAPKSLSATGEDSGLPDLAFDAAGDAIAIWGRAVGAPPYVIQGAGYDFSGPRLDALQIPATGTVGEPVSFAVSPFDVFSLGGTSWTFGDGSQAAGGNSVSHVYDAPGAYPVTVSALDASGNATIRTETIAIAGGPINSPPPPPPPNPQIALSLRIEGESLRKLVRTRKLRVAASVNEAASVALSGRARLKLGARRARARLIPVFVPKTVRFTTASDEKVTLKLSKRGRKALLSRSQVKILVAGEARNDAGDVATKAVTHVLR